MLLGGGNNAIYLICAKSGEWRKLKIGVEMRSSVPRSSPIAHRIAAIHHLAGRLWRLCAYEGPIHQLHHPYSKTSWLPQRPASSLSSRRNNCVSCRGPNRKSVAFVDPGFPGAPLPARQRGDVNSICLGERDVTAGRKRDGRFVRRGRGR